MLRIFRNMRNNLLSQNRFTHYMFYAIGEIVLVVIGILIALQINNWNELRKIRLAEQEILQNLKSELLINKENLEIIHQKHTSVYNDGDYLLKLFYTDISNISVKKLDTILGNFETGWSFEPRDGYIKSLISTGKIDYLQNEEIKAFITAFESHVIDATQDFVYIQKQLHERLWPSIDGKINASNRFLTQETNPNFPKGSYESDYQWFFSNREMEDVISNIMSWQQSEINDELKLLDDITDMIEIIENELKH